MECESPAEHNAMARSDLSQIALRFARSSSTKSMTVAEIVTDWPVKTGDTTIRLTLRLAFGEAQGSLRASH
jgi:hypothetical protein